ncbi:hypothetical protein Goari_021084 [Gossypium aridum]|uniref:Uncharacterized protein n=1 Tax=Gossypium aridum TaxID=34290 RepID=A0A7J8YD73_GOSAI|nr:hypothetical protein [Gossypium aridum]
MGILQQEIVKIKRELSQLDAKIDAKLEARFKDFKDELMVKYGDTLRHFIACIDDDERRDDNDLYIVMRQHLKFFRIDVQLNTDRLDKPCAIASQSSTPLRLPSLHPPLKGFNVVAADSSKQPMLVQLARITRKAYTRAISLTLDKP